MTWEPRGRAAWKLISATVADTRRVFRPVGAVGVMVPRLMRTFRGENVMPVIAISVDDVPGVTVTVPVPTLAEIPAGVSVAGSLMPMSTRNAFGSTAYQLPLKT